MAFRGKKRRFWGLFLVNLILLSAWPFLFCNGQETGNGHEPGKVSLIDKERAIEQSLLVFLGNVWQKVLLRWEWLRERLESFLGDSFGPKTREVIPYLRKEFQYRQSILKPEFEKEMAELKQDITKIFLKSKK